MKKNKKNSGLSPLALIIIITTSIVAAVGIILLVLKLVQKKRAAKAVSECDCCCDGLDPWELGDDDILGEISFDDEEEIEDECCECECDGCCECETKIPEEISAAVDEAIDAITAVTDSIEDGEN